jgi:two-component system chemotaxis sensor kinase CheA
VRIEAHKLDALVAAVGRLRAARARISAQAAGIEELRALASQHLAGWGHTVRRLRAPAAAAALPGLLASDFIRAHDDLARLADAAGRLSLSAREGQRALALATDEVIHGIRGARMRRFSDACVPLPRAVRDLAAASGREVQLEIFGADVEADRDVVDVLSDVLLHLVRNAVDHGLEPPDERARAGKPRTGTVTVTASHAGSGLRITVADNGRGLRLQSIRDRLVERGEPVPDDARALARVLFQPGFSTRSEANDISGRGVGLDVVRTSLEQIGGSVDLHWSEGQGATFTLQCPATLSTLRALLVGVDSQRFAIPTLHVERLSRIRPDQVVRVQGKPSIPTRNGPIPLVSLATVLGPPLRANPATEVMQVVRLAIGGRRVALAVDELIAEEEIIVRPLDRIRRPPASIAGAALLPDGQVALVLHASVILETALGHEGSDVGLADPARPLPAPKRILVVDDSITTRTLEASIQQTAGFEVATAVDGEDAWRLLQAQTFDLVVSDVEMPRMDGFALCRAIRGAPRLAKTPLVLVSALETAEHRRLGLEAGADAYLPKSSFDQRDLLDTIQQLLD